MRNGTKALVMGCPLIGSRIQHVPVGRNSTEILSSEPMVGDLMPECLSEGEKIVLDLLTSGKRRREAMMGQTRKAQLFGR